jgi:hypothetical protein
MLPNRRWVALGAAVTSLYCTRLSRVMQLSKTTESLLASSAFPAFGDEESLSPN